MIGRREALMLLASAALAPVAAPADAAKVEPGRWDEVRLRRATRALTAYEGA